VGGERWSWDAKSPKESISAREKKRVGQIGERKKNATCRGNNMLRRASDQMKKRAQGETIRKRKCTKKKNACTDRREGKS